MHRLTRQGRILPLLKPIAFALCMLLTPAVGAADLGSTPLPIARPADTGALRSALDQYAVLLMIRASFDVLPAEAIADELVIAVAKWGADGPSPDEQADLDQSLLAEASYYLTSLKYLVEFGGAAFLGAGATIENDTLVELYGLRRRLFGAVADHEDTLPVLVEAQRVRALTEGSTAVPPAQDRFAGRDAIVARVLASVGPTARS